MISQDSKQAVQICVIGCGYVGVTTAAVLANCGFEVLAIESNPQRLEILKTGRSFFYEAGVDALLTSGIKQGSLRFSDTIDEALSKVDFVFSCVGTPDNPDGSSNLSYVYEVAEKAAVFMEPASTFIQKSTVPVGTGANLQSKFLAKKIGYVSNPEFLREGTAISDTLWFDRIVAGSDTQQESESVLELYRTTETARQRIAKIANVKPPKNIPTTNYLATSLPSAELIKVTANAFLALKISFANSIAKLADASKADIGQVMDAVGADARIGRAFLNAGRGYGGGCFPKDVSGLISSAKDYGVAMEVMEAANAVNQSMPTYILHQAQKAFGSGFKNVKIAILGLAFKAGTSDARRSPAIQIANSLAGLGAQVTAYDPQARAEAAEHLNARISLAASAKEAIQDASIIFIATDWPEFKSASTVLEGSTATLVVDCMNCLQDLDLLKIRSVTYLGVGKR